MRRILLRAKEALSRIKEQGQSWGDPGPILQDYADLLDRMVGDLFREMSARSASKDMALVAVGGYGRKELTPWSDVDLMFLCHETSSQETLETIYSILHALWDLHLEVGHSVRTIQDCVEVALRDIPTWTALLDGRFLAGNQGLFLEFHRTLSSELTVNEKDKFVKGLLGSIRERHRSYSRAPFLLEPHLKNGPGGLRDYQAAMWLTRAVFPVKNLQDMVQHALLSQDEIRELQQAHSFLWQVRLQLHRTTARKEDQLTFGLQELLAKDFPARASGSVLTESFMREYYRHTTRVRYFVEECIQKVTDPSLGAGPEGPSYAPQGLGPGFQVIRGRLTLVDEGVFSQDPAKMMEAIAFAHKHGIELDLFTRDEIKASLHMVDAGFCRSRRVRDAFLSILDTDDCGYAALELMHRLGLLQTYIPEFGRICFQVQHDAYHAYTVDVHCLETVRELALIRQNKNKGSAKSLSSQVASELESWGALVLAALLHDIGKGNGSGHALKGASLVRAILDRWWVPRSQAERTIFLVKEHITLMDTALGRDLTEEKVVVELCRTVGCLARLNDLYLLTLADLRATGPDLLTEWKDQLLKELYLKSRRILETGDLVSPESTLRVREAREKVRGALKDRLSQPELEKWLEVLPPRYLLTTEQELLVEQVLLAIELVGKKGTVLLAQRNLQEHQEIIVCTRDAPRLFSRICGVMVAHGLNILAARIHTWTNGIAMDTFRVEPLGGRSNESLDSLKIKEMEKDLEAVLQGELAMEELMAKRARAPAGPSSRYPAVKPRIRIDNRSSDFYTVVEVRAGDRFGLLFLITSVLAQLELGVHVAIIDTRRGQVVDVFYVQDASGQKVWDKARLAQVERSLHQAMEKMESSGLALIQ